MPPAEASMSTLAGAQLPKKPPLNHDSYHPSPHVLSAWAGDTMVLMDRKRGTYHTLNEVGGRVWELVGAGAKVAQVVERLMVEYDVLRPQIDRDVAAMLRQLIEAQLLVLGSAAVSMPAQHTPKPPVGVATNAGEIKVPSVLRCGLLIAWFKRLLRVRGFAGTLEWIRHQVESLPATTETAIATVRAVEYAVAMAGALYPGRAKCLEQSLTLYYLLRRHRVAAVYCQGVQLYPFQAHAWVEYRDEVINDVPEHARFFARLPEQLP